MLALEQALQQIQGAPARLPGMPLILPQLLAHRCEHLRLHERWDRDRDPVLWWDITDGHRPAWLHGATALGTQPRPQGLLACLAKRRSTCIGWVLQNAPHHTPIPDGLAGAGHLACLGEPPTDLANRQAVASDPGKDLADHTGLVRDQLIAGLATPLILGDIAVPVGRAAQHIHRPDMRGMPLPASVPFDNLGAFILGNHALHLQEQVIFRTVAQRVVQEDDLHPGTAELIHQQDLVGIFPGQALQRRADQCSPAIAFVKELHRLRHRQAIGGHAFPQRGDLTPHCVCVGLLGRRHAGIERHLGWLHKDCLLPTGCVCGACYPAVAGEPGGWCDA